VAKKKKLPLLLQRLWLLLHLLQMPLQPQHPLTLLLPPLRLLTPLLHQQPMPQPPLTPSQKRKSSDGLTVQGQARVAWTCAAPTTKKAADSGFFCVCTSAVRGRAGGVARAQAVRHDVHRRLLL
jgi:hypothetical protein